MNHRRLCVTALLVPLFFAGCDEDPLSAGGLCSTAADCPPGQLCKGGACTATCDTAAECYGQGVGVQCVDRSCVGSLSARAEAAPSAGEGELVTLDASATLFIGDGEPTWRWTQTEGAAVEIVYADHAVAQFQAPAVVADELLGFEVQVQAAGHTQTVQVAVSIENTINEAPVAALKGPGEPVPAGSAVPLDASASSDPNPGDALTFQWEPAGLIVDAGGGAATLTAPAPAEALKLVVTVTVSDGHDTASATIVVAVLPVPTACPASCDDGDPCTADACVDPAVGCTHEAATGPPCDDGDACTVEDACVAGACAGQAVGCPSPGACHVSLGCSPVSGECEVDDAPDGVACEGQAPSLCVQGDCRVDACALADALPDALAAGLLAWYRFDDAADATVLDASGHGWHGAVPEGVAPAPASDRFGAPGSAWLFGGGLEHLELPAALALSGPLSYSVWVRAASPDATTRSVLCFEAGSDTKSFLTFGPPHAGFDQYPPSGGTLWSADPYTAGVWHHLAYTATGQGPDHTERLFVDGELAVERLGTEVYDGGAPTAGIVGNRLYLPDEYSFIGHIDDLRIYGAALSPEQINGLSACQPCATLPDGALCFDGRASPEGGACTGGACR